MHPDADGMDSGGKEKTPAMSSHATIIAQKFSRLVTEGTGGRDSSHTLKRVQEAVVHGGLFLPSKQPATKTRSRRYVLATSRSCGDRGSAAVCEGRYDFDKSCIPENNVVPWQLIIIASSVSGPMTTPSQERKVSPVTHSHQRRELGLAGKAGRANGPGCNE